MAKKNISKETSYLKIGLLCFALVVFVVWRLMSGFSLPKTAANPPQASAPTAAPASPPAPAAKPEPVPASSPASTPVTEYKAVQTNDFMKQLLTKYRPRLSLSAFSPETGLVGNVEFYDDLNIVESYSIKELHALGAILLRKPYGIDLIYDNKSFIVSSWILPEQSQRQPL